jgi:hypothetical protein
LGTEFLQQSQEKGKAKNMCKVCADREKHYTGEADMQLITEYHQKYDLVLCFGDYFEIYQTKAIFWE